jgi:hypothetical protein
MYRVHFATSTVSPIDCRCADENKIAAVIRCELCPWIGLLENIPNITAEKQTVKRGYAFIKAASNYKSGCEVVALLHGLADRQIACNLLVSMRHRAGGGFHAQNSLARSKSRGNVASFLYIANDAISPREAMTRNQCEFADPLIRALLLLLNQRPPTTSWRTADGNTCDF